MIGDVFSGMVAFSYIGIRNCRMVVRGREEMASEKAESR